VVGGLFQSYYVSYSLLLNYTYLFSEGGLSLRTYYRGLNQRMRDQFGVPEHELILWGVFRDSVWKFWKHVLKLNLKDLFKCPKCGPFSSHLVCNGVSIGLLIGPLRGIDNLIVPFYGPEVIDNPKY
jgi:hypothetical protein